MRVWIGLLGLILMLSFSVACGGGPQGDVGAPCTKDTECSEEKKLTCATNFISGYCTIKGCTSDSNCPTGSACVSHSDGNKYCFKTCQEKEECTSNSACTINVIFTGGATGNKACKPEDKV